MGGTAAVRRPARFADERASARLLFAPELAAGALTASDVDRPAVWSALSSKPVPTRLSRRIQVGLVRRGALGYERTTVPALMAARRTVLGDAAAGAPRPLVRVDGLRLAGALRRAFAAAGVPFLAAATAREALAEAELVGALRRDGTTLALVDPGEELDDALAQLERAAIRPRVVVAPGGSLTPRRWAALAERFDVVCADPGSVATIGYHHTPLWRRGAVHLPAYPPLSDDAGEAAAALARLRAAGAALWVPVVVRAADRDGLERLLAIAGELDASWDALLLAADDAARAATARRAS
jgi:hypothetical protein